MHGAGSLRTRLPSRPIMRSLDFRLVVPQTSFKCFPSVLSALSLRYLRALVCVCVCVWGGGVRACVRALVVRASACCNAVLWSVITV